MIRSKIAKSNHAEYKSTIKISLFTETVMGQIWPTGLVCASFELYRAMWLLFKYGGYFMHFFRYFLPCSLITIINIH